jgi:hypothetical protein
MDFLLVTQFETQLHERINKGLTYNIDLTIATFQICFLFTVLSQVIYL